VCCLTIGELRQQLSYCRVSLNVARCQPAPRSFSPGNGRVKFVASYHTRLTSIGWNAASRCSSRWGFSIRAKISSWRSPICVSLKADEIRYDLRPVPDPHLRSNHVRSMKNAHRDVVECRRQACVLVFTIAENPEFCVASSIDPEVNQSPCFSRDIGQPFTKCAHLGIRLKQKPCIMRRHSSSSEWHSDVSA
jgi:hypothetical protein